MKLSLHMARNVIHLSESTIENLINGPQNQRQLESSISVTNRFIETYFTVWFSTTIHLAKNKRKQKYLSPIYIQKLGSRLKLLQCSGRHK